MVKFILNKKNKRLRRAYKFREHLKRLKKNRLIIHRTSRHLYAQIIIPKSYHVVVSASTLEKKIIVNLKYTGNKEAAALIGKIIAERAIQKGIKEVAFDRSGFKYHGRVQIFAQSARNAGLIF